MNPQNTVVRQSFATGIVMPGVHNRTDWDRHDAAVADAVNFTVGPAGGMIKRPGFRYLGTALHDDTPVRLGKVQFSPGQAYILEFGDEVMRFYTDVVGADGSQQRGMILNDDGTEYRLATPYTAEQVAKFTFAQDKDAMFFAHWDKPVHVLTRHAHNRWVWSRLFDNVPDRVLAPETVDFFDAASNGHNGYEYIVTAAKNVDGTFQESAGGYSMASSAPAEYGLIAEAPQDSFDSCVQWMNKYRRLYGDLPGFPPSAVAETFDLSGVYDDAESSGGYYLHPKILAVWKLKYPSAQYGYRYRHWIERSQRWNLYWGIYTGYPPPSSVSNNNLWGYYGTNELWAGTGYESPGGYYGWYDPNGNRGVWSVPGVYSISSTTFMRDIALRWINNNEVAVNGWTRASLYSGIMAFIESHNINNTVKTSNHIKWAASEGAERYYVYRRPLEGDDRNFYRIADLAADTLDFFEPNVRETVPMAETPPQGESSFNDEDRYPSLVSFYQQRLILGATKEKPTTIWGSKTGIYTDFTVNLGGNEALYSAYEFKMASETSDPLKAILPLRTLYILTSGGAFVSTVSGAMNASNVNFNQEAYRGASDVPPLLLDKIGIYAPLGLQTINALAYDFAADGFKDDNLLESAQHLTETNNVAGLDYLRSPIDLIVAHLADGSLISCTYIPGSGFRAWTRHTTQGRILSTVAYTNDSGRDELWAVVERSLGNGTRKRYIEVLEDIRPFRGEPTAESSFYVDCGMSAHFDAPVSVVTGLEHLEGLEVAILADFVQFPKTVRNGTVELDNPAQHIHVGLGYEAYLRTLDLEPQNAPTLRGTRRRVYKAQVEVERTRDLSYSMNGGEAYDAVFTTGANLGLPAQPWSGDIQISGKAGTTKGSYLELRSRYPLPCTINSVVAEIQYAG